jgi:hypothetical protein
MCYIAVNKSYKTLENEEGYKRCKEIVDEAKVRADEAVCCDAYLGSIHTERVTARHASCQKKIKWYSYI